jgi:hypothetical protein
MEPEKIETGKTIKVVGKGDFGVHAVHGEIIKGKEYEIDEGYFTDALFELPAKTVKGVE